MSDREILKNSEDNQKKFRDYVEKSKDFSSIEKRAISIDSQSAFEEYWRNVNNAREDFDLGHEKGCGLFGRRFQGAVTSVEPFFNEFSPLIDAVKNFGAPYGGLAVGTISILFVVGIECSPPTLMRLVLKLTIRERWQETKPGWKTPWTPSCLRSVLVCQLSSYSQKFTTKMNHWIRLCKAT